MKEPTPDELREFFALVKIFYHAGRKLGMPDEIIDAAVLQAPTPFGNLLRECSADEMQAINEALEWKDVLDEAERKRRAANVT